MRVVGVLKRLFSRPYATVRSQEVAALLAAGAILLDVREPAEWRAGHAPTARHIPLGQLSTRVGELPAGRPIVTVCQSGMRSARAASLLAVRGREVSNLAGGMSAWSRAGLPVITKNGRAA